MRWLRHAVRKIVRQLPHRRGLKSHDPFVIIRHLDNIKRLVGGSELSANKRA